MKELLSTCLAITAVQDSVLIQCPDFLTAEELAGRLLIAAEEGRSPFTMELACLVPFLARASSLEGFEQFFVDYFITCCAKTTANWIICRNLTSNAQTLQGRALHELALKHLRT